MADLFRQIDRWETGTDRRRTLFPAPAAASHGLRQFKNAVEPQEFQHSLDWRLDITQDHFRSIGRKVAINAEQKSDARAIDELDISELHLRAFDPRIDPAFEMVLDDGRGAGVEAREIHCDVENFARDICLEFIGHIGCILPRCMDYAMRNPRMQNPPPDYAGAATSGKPPKLREPEGSAQTESSTRNRNLPNTCLDTRLDLHNSQKP